MSATAVLSKMAQPAPEPEPPFAPDAVLARALRRAADKQARLDLTVSKVKVAETAFPKALAGLAAPDLVLEAHVDGVCAGVVVLCPSLRDAVVEGLTVGKIDPDADQNRAATGADAALARPLLGAFWDECAGALHGSTIDGWLDQVTLGPRVMSLKLLDLSLPEGPVGEVLLTCALGDGARQGQLRLLLPPPPEPEDAPGEAPLSWAARWDPVAQAMPVRLGAVLHKQPLTLGQVDGLAVGSLLLLEGADLDGLKLFAPGGMPVCRGRLGQISGHRAVRVDMEPRAPLDADALPLISGAEGAEGLLEGATIDLMDPEAPDLQIDGDLPDLPMGDLPGDGGLPDLPDLPGDGGLPDLPMGDLPDLPGDGGLPDLPDLPGDGGLPDLPEGGGLPDLPEGGGLPDLPDLPGNGDLPDLPMGDLPDLPGDAGLPDLPDLPEAGGLPDLPDLPGEGGLPDLPLPPDESS